jgi:hypothetical protein
MPQSGFDLKLKASKPVLDELRGLMSNLVAQHELLRVTALKSEFPLSFKRNPLLPTLPRHDLPTAYAAIAVADSASNEASS